MCTVVQKEEESNSLHFYALSIIKLLQLLLSIQYLKYCILHLLWGILSDVVHDGCCWVRGTIVMSTALEGAVA